MTDDILLLLASNSPRRRQLMALGNWKFTIQSADVDETPQNGESPRDYVLRLAEAKATAVTCCANGEHFVVAADTAVVDGTSILGKPVDENDARAMLKHIRGRIHQVYTSLAVLRIRDGKFLTDLCITQVPMRDYSDVEIQDYVHSGDPLDKAGAYAIQHPDFMPVEHLQGCYASVMGLPLCHLTRLLKQMDIHPLTDVPAACQLTLNYQCPVSHAILRGEQVG